MRSNPLSPPHNPVSNQLSTYIPSFQTMKIAKTPTTECLSIKILNSSSSKLTKEKSLLPVMSKCGDCQKKASGQKTAKGQFWIQQWTMSPYGLGSQPGSAIMGKQSAVIGQN